MPRFAVQITGEGLDRAIQALNAAGIPTLGPAFTSVDSGPQTVGKIMDAVPDAPDDYEAERMVRAALPADGDYRVAKPVLIQPDE
jgi:hypothetical protein